MASWRIGINAEIKQQMYTDVTYMHFFIEA